MFLLRAASRPTCAKSIGQSSGAAAALRTEKRYITRIYTSFYSGELYPNQLVRPKQRMPEGVNYQSVLKRGSAGAQTGKPDANAKKKKPAVEGVSWDNAHETDVAALNDAVEQEARGGKSALRNQQVAHKSERPYVPLAEVAKLELQGDYYTEGGMHQEALEHYGVVAKAYSIAYPEDHSQRVGILIKLAGALRRTNRLESSRANLESAIAMLDRSQRPSLELLCEAFMELGLTQEALGDAARAAQTFEEAFTIVDAFYNFGESHRMLRLLPRLGRRFNLNHEEKFVYFSPFDYDRTFAIVDQCMEHAERCYENSGDADGVVRVLSARKQLIDKKFFNMRDFAGRIRTMRGHWMRRASHLTNAPTPEELLRYTPTVHQVYRDFKYELNAPIGRESEVMQGTNRKVLDMGNPYRKRGVVSVSMLRDADNNFAKFTRQREFND